MLYFLTPIIAYLIVFVLFPYKTLQITLRIIGKLIFNKKRIGYSIPKSGGALLIANHISHLDFILVTLATKRKVYFVMYDKIYYHKAVHWILKRLNMIPIAPSRTKDQNGLKNNLKKFNEKCQEIINRGDIVVIYPEGTVSRNGHLLEFKRGMEHIATSINAPIIPMHVYGATGSPFTFSIEKNTFFKFKIRNLKKRIIINVGKPLPNSTSSFQARQKVLELAAESAFYAHSNKYENFTNAVFKQKNNTTLFYNNTHSIKAKELKISTLEFSSVLKGRLKNTSTAIVSISDELLLIKVLLALSYLGKNIILVHPNTSQQDFSQIQKKFQSALVLNDKASSNNSNHYDTSLLLIKNKFHSRFMAALPFLFFRIAKIRKKATSQTSFYFTNNCIQGGPIDKLSLTNINAFVESISNTHKIKEYGKTMNIKDTYSPIGFLTKISLPIMKGLSVIINYSSLQENLTQANTLIGEQNQLETLFETIHQDLWKNIHTIITDDNLSKQFIAFTQKQNIRIYKATGIEGIIGLLSINTPNYKGKDIAGKVLKQDGNIPSTYGRPVQGVAVKIVHPEDKTKSLEANQEGLVLVKGPLVMHPTHNSPFTWVDVKLKGYINQKGYLQLT